MKCKICGLEFKTISYHIRYKHPEYTIKEYYDKFLRKNNEGFCENCGKESIFININKGYSKCCCNDCRLAILRSDNNYAKRPECKQKISEKLKGNKHTLGYKFTEEQRKNVKLAIKKSWDESPERKLKLSQTIYCNPKYKQGYFDSKKNGKKIHYRSSFELEMYNILENIEEVLEYDTECLGIEYIYRGKKKMYLPDVIVKFKDLTYIIEIKPKHMLSDELNMIKFQAARQYCELNNMKFLIVTEDELFGENKIQRAIDFAKSVD